MLVQALAEYADRHLADQLDDPAFESKPVRFFLELGEDGRFLGFRERTDTVTRGKKSVSVVQQLTVCKSPVSRNSGLHPLLACDDMKYVVGPGEWTEPKDLINQQQRHDAFVALLRRAAASTGNAALMSATRFYDRPEQVVAATAALAACKPVPGSMVCLYVSGPLTADPAARDFWRDHFNRAFDKRSEKGGVGTCLISGVFGPVAATHDKIKGLGNLGGQAAGVSLMSFDKAAFRSYGWEQNANSPVAPSRATAYVLALNDLLKAGSVHRRDHAGVAFVFWTKLAPDDDTFDSIENATPEQVKRLLQLDAKAVRDPDRFYFAGVSGNGGRLLVRHWFSDSLVKVKQNVKNWFAGLRIADAFTGKVAAPPPLWRILKTISRDEPPAERTLQLLRRAIEGQPLGRSMLAALMNRLRAAQGNERLEPERLGLIRLCVNDLTEGRKGAAMTEALDKDQTNLPVRKAAGGIHVSTAQGAGRYQRHGSR